MARAAIVIGEGVSTFCQQCVPSLAPSRGRRKVPLLMSPKLAVSPPLFSQKATFIGSYPIPRTQALPSARPVHRHHPLGVVLALAAGEGHNSGEGATKSTTLRRKKASAGGASSTEIASPEASTEGAPTSRGRKKKVVGKVAEASSVGLNGEAGPDASLMMDGMGEESGKDKRKVKKPARGKTREEETGMMERPSWIDDDDAEPRWYVAAVFAGWEQKLANTFNTMLADDARMSRLIREVLVPTVPTGKICKDGRPSKAVRKLMPGYLLFRCALTRESRKYISDVDGVMDFVGARKSTGYVSYETLPRPLSDAEVSHLFRLMEEGKKVSEAPRFPLAVNDVIEVTDGPFKEFAGEVVEVYPKENKVKAILSIFGRDTPVELAVDACRKRSAVV